MVVLNIMLCTTITNHLRHLKKPVFVPQEGLQLHMQHGVNPPLSDAGKSGISSLKGAAPKDNTGTAEYWTLTSEL